MTRGMRSAVHGSMLPCMADTAYYRSAGNAGGLVNRLHILRTTPFTRPNINRDRHMTKQGFCGQAAYSTRTTPIMITPLPQTPPPGLAWCPLCIGRYAEHLGVLGELAQAVALEGNSR